MSFGEIKYAINSTLGTEDFAPLNIASLINHIDLIGSSYVGSADEAVMLLKSNGLYLHEVARTVVFDLLKGDTATGEAMREYIDSKLSASTGVGAWLALISDIDNAALVACNDMTAVAASETAMTAVIASETAMTAVIASETAMTAVANSETAMAKVFESTTAKNAIWDSESASMILMENALSREWMLTNKSIVDSASASYTSFQSIYSGKCFVLKHYKPSNQGTPRYRYIQPANNEISVIATGEENVSYRVYPLEKINGYNLANIAATITYVKLG